MTFKMIFGFFAIIAAFVGVIFLKEFIVGSAMFLFGISNLITEPKLFTKDGEFDENTLKKRKSIAIILDVIGIVFFIIHIIL